MGSDLEGAPDAAQAAEYTAQDATREIAQYLELGCQAAATRTGFDGFKTNPEEAELVAKRVEPLMRRYFPQLDPIVVEWSLAIGTVGWFAGSRWMAYKDWKAEQEKTTQPTASPTPPPKPDATPQPETGSQTHGTASQPEFDSAAA